MFVLNYESIDISGFAGIRERVLVMDRNYFSRHVADEVRDGFGACVYLAHAYFTPGGSTGLHYHKDVDIISIFTKGEVQHQGTLGDGMHFFPGQVLVQCSGENGFRHNEMNALDDISGMVQIWCEPSDTSALTQRHEVIDVNALGVHRVYGGTQEDALTNIPHTTQFDLAVMSDGQEIKLAQQNRLYVLAGEVLVQEEQASQILKRGSLCDGRQLHIKANTAAKVLIITQV
ncbi:MAG: pirin family protein [Gammaproteobacteria bacterium]|nr:pirin family protein [Gammaproteobacteria bacterium]